MSLKNKRKKSSPTAPVKGPKPMPAKQSAFQEATGRLRSLTWKDGAKAFLWTNPVTMGPTTVVVAGGWLWRKVREKLASKSNNNSQTPPVLGAGGKCWPVTDKTIRSKFKEVRGSRRHGGIDVRAIQGTSLVAPIDGMIQRVKPDPSNQTEGGSTIYLLGNDGYIQHFMHLSHIGVTQGQKVKAGELMGKTGGTPGMSGSGSSTQAQHLHWGIQAPYTIEDVTYEDAKLKHLVGPEEWWAGTLPKVQKK